jgi:hypothetical protein
MDECKILAWARDNMFRHSGLLSFPDLQFSRGELHFDLLLQQIN